MQKDTLKKVSCTKCHGIGNSIKPGLSPLLAKPTPCTACKGRGYMFSKVPTVCMKVNNGPI